MSSSMPHAVIGWMNKNREKLALAGLLDKQAGYGLRRVPLGDKSGPAEKQAAINDTIRRDNATTILGRYIDKVASTAPSEHVRPLKKAHAALLGGENINTAMAAAYPGLQPEQRGQLAHSFAKRAMAHYLEAAGLKTASEGETKRPPRTVGREEYTGSPSSSVEWMKKQTAAMS